MTIPQLKHSELMDLLKDNGWELVSDKFWNDYNRLILGKEGDVYVLQYRNSYTFLFVVRLCWSLGIDPPEDHLKAYNQYEDMKNKRKGS